MPPDPAAGVPGNTPLLKVTPPGNVPLAVRDSAGSPDAVTVKRLARRTVNVASSALVIVGAAETGVQLIVIDRLPPLDETAPPLPAGA